MFKEFQINKNTVRSKRATKQRIIKSLALLIITLAAIGLYIASSFIGTSYNTNQTTSVEVEQQICSTDSEEVNRLPPRTAMYGKQLRKFGEPLLMKNRRNCSAGLFYGILCLHFRFRFAFSNTAASSREAAPSPWTPSSQDGSRAFPQRGQWLPRRR